MSLAAATRSEVTKQFTTAAWWVLGLVLIGYVATMVALMGFTFSWGLQNGGSGMVIPESTVPPLVYSVAGTMGFVLPLLFGTLMVTSEFRHKLLVPTFLATPKRGTVLVGKLIVGVLMGVLFGVAAVVVGVGVGAGILTLFGTPPQLDEIETWKLAGRIVLAFVLWTIVGIGIGSIVRNQIAAIVIVLAFTQFVEPMLRLAGMFLPDLNTALQYLPGAASDAVIGYSLLGMAGMGDTDILSWWMGAITLAAYAIVLTVIGALTTWRRDVT